MASPLMLISGALGVQEISYCLPVAGFAPEKGPSTYSQAVLYVRREPLYEQCDH